MSDPGADLTLLRHKLDAEQAALAFTVGKALADLTAESKLQFALVRDLETVGEAAPRLTEPPCMANLETLIGPSNPPASNEA